MIFGRKEKLAFEVHVQPRVYGGFVSLGIWLKNQRFGVKHQKSLLSSEIHVLENILKFKEKRKINSLETLTRDEMLNLLKALLWEVEPIKPSLQSFVDKMSRSQKESLKYLDIYSNEGENFQKIYVFLLETKNCCWIICNDSISDETEDLILDCNEFYFLIGRIVEYIRPYIAGNN